MYRHLDAALVRAPAWDAGNLGVPWPDLTGTNAKAAEWREWLDQAWQVPEVADAVEAASPDLARQVARILAEADVPEAAVRRAILAVLRYLLRGSRGSGPEGVQVRATPPVRAALDAARSPVWVADLTAKLAAGFPEATSDMISSLFAQLISLGFLLTSLRAPMTAPDPLATLLTGLQAASLPAQQGMIRSEQEITLDDAFIAELAAVGPGDPVQPSTELTVRVHAATIPDLDAGRFTLHVLGVSRAAGTATGRFLHLLEDGDQERMRGVYVALPGVHDGSLLAQISATPLHAKSHNVGRTPQAAGLLISIGEHCAARPAQLVPLSDLAVTADISRLHLVSVSRRRPVHTIFPSAVDLTIHTHPLARFLLEAPVALAAPCTAFDWGAASTLPFLPALRYRRTVISPARWMLIADDLPGREGSWTRWDDALTAWARQSSLPQHVYAGDGDRCLALDLAQPSHRALLRADLDRTGKARLRAAPEPDDLGWADGHPHEITIPLSVTGPAMAPVRWQGEVTRRGHGHLPGCDGRLYLKLYAPRDLQDAILTRHLPELAARIGDQASWWFIRYDDPEPHLRLRLTLDATEFGAAAELVATWTSELRDAGLVARVSWETYYPEAARFGGTAVMGATEAFFAADSTAAVAQLSASADNRGPDATALTAASMADIAAAVTGDDAEAMHWLTEHAKPDATPPPRDVYDQAVALVCERPDMTGTTAGITHAWLARRAALAAYSSALEQAGTITLADLLPDLLHLHHARIAGPDLTAERACLHLARAAAFSWLARTKRKAS
jgi:lantibiotic biosynthesis protein